MQVKASYYAGGALPDSIVNWAVSSSKGTQKQRREEGGGRRGRGGERRERGERREEEGGRRAEGKFNNPLPSLSYFYSFFVGYYRPPGLQAYTFGQTKQDSKLVRRTQKLTGLRLRYFFILFYSFSSFIFLFFCFPSRCSLFFKCSNHSSGKTGEQGTHCVKILFKGGWPSPPTPVFVDAEVSVIDLNNQTLTVCPPISTVFLCSLCIPHVSTVGWIVIFIYVVLLHGLYLLFLRPLQGS